MKLQRYDRKIIRVTDPDGRLITGIAEFLAPGYCLRAFGREEEGVRIGEHVLLAPDIRKIEEMPDLAILRATETWQQAGAYYVRIQAMAKKHHITLREEFDEHDAPDTRYIVVTDRDFPIATARIYPLDEERMMIGRVVVLPEYRRQGIGTMVVRSCEEWAGEQGCSIAVLESRDNKVEFYRQMGYEVCGEAVDGETFRCVRMEKRLREPELTGQNTVV